MTASDSKNRVATSYVFWLLGLVGINGAHRLYNGKIATGLLWLLTFGLFGIGQFIDVFFVPGMARERQRKLLTGENPLPHPTIAHDQAMMQLLKAAQKLDGRISVTQGVMETGLSFSQVETLLKEMVKAGYVAVDNDPRTGVVTYHFFELVTG